MKKIALFLCLVFICLSFTCCSSCGFSKTETLCTEQQVRQLMERNLDCYIAVFALSHLPHTGDEVTNGFYQVSTSYFNSYKELDDFVRSTYTKEKADELMNVYPENQGPLYKEINSMLCVNTKISPAQENYSVTWNDDYKVEFLSNDKEKCTFKLTTTEVNSEGVENPYVIEGSAVFEDGKYKLTEMYH